MAFDSSENLQRGTQSAQDDDVAFFRGYLIVLV